MRKWMKFSLLGLTAMMVATGCSKAADTKETSTATAGETTTGSTEATEAGSESAATEAVKPEKPENMGTVTLGQYKGLQVDVPKYTVTDEELEGALIQILSPYGETTEDAPGPAKLGDVVNIDYAGYKDGVAFDGGTAQGTDLTLGSNSFIPGFEPGLVGVKKGDKVSLDLTFPKEYGSAELAGQAVVFEVTVNSIKAVELPTLTDAFVAEKFPDDGTVEKFKEGVKESLATQKQENANMQKEAKLFNMLLEGTEVSPSEEGINYVYDMQVYQYTLEASMYGMELKDYITQSYGMDETTFQTELKKIAGEIAKQELILAAIADEEKLEATDEELDTLAKEYGYADKAEMLSKESEEEAVTMVRMRKALDVVFDSAVVNEVEATEE